MSDLNPSDAIVWKRLNKEVDLLLEVLDLHGRRSPREPLLRVNNASARETSWLSPERFDRMIGAASVATFIAPAKAFLLAFEQADDYDGARFKWFCSHYDRFLYVDRVVSGLTPIFDLGIYYAECVWLRRTRLEWIVTRGPDQGGDACYFSPYRRKII
jgi:hypothetical protein